MSSTMQMAEDRLARHQQGRTRKVGGWRQRTKHEREVAYGEDREGAINGVMDALRKMDAHPDYVARLYINAVMAECHGNRSHAAERMGMHRRTLQRILQKDVPVRKPVRIEPPEVE